MLAPCRCVLLQCLKCRTCDVVLGGVTLKEAFENAAVAMFNYMTPLTAVIVDESHNRRVEASGQDLQSLLFAFLDELLFVFSTELLICKEVSITEFDREIWRITALGSTNSLAMLRCLSSLTYEQSDVNGWHVEFISYILGAAGQPSRIRDLLHHYQVH
eukprot:jgi/Chrzof1/9517/Cz04g06070.t1